MNTENTTHRIPLTQGKFATVDACDYEWAMQWKWYATFAGNESQPIWYAVRNPRVPETIKTYLHRAIASRCGFTKIQDVDHRDHDGLNDTRANLRPATRSQNLGNRRKADGCSSGFKGVYFYGNRRKGWMAQITVRGTTFNLGYFLTENEAHTAYIMAARLHFGEFANDGHGAQ